MVISSGDERTGRLNREAGRTTLVVTHQGRRTDGETMRIKGHENDKSKELLADEA